MCPWKLLALVAGLLPACYTLDKHAVPNHPPIANAGSDQTVLGGTPVTLSGSASDADDDPVTLSWAQVGGDAVTLSSSTDPEVTFTAPEHAQTLVFSLTANDGIDDSLASLVEITVRFNRAPVADAGGPQRLLNRQSSTLDGSGSADPDGDPITYQWTVEAGPPGSGLTTTLAGATTRYPVFTPDRKGNYTLSLVVSDGSLASPADYAVITATNNPPTADAGPSAEVTNGQPLALSGSATDVDVEDSVTVRWSVGSGPADAAFPDFSSTTALAPSFTPHGRGLYLLTLVASDGTDESSPVAVLIAAANNSPTVTATAQSTPDHEPLALAAHAADADGDPVSVTWEMLDAGGRAYTLGVSVAGVAVFTPHNKGGYSLRVTPFDGREEGTPVDVTVTATNLPPVAAIEASKAALSTGESLTLSALSSTDPDGTPPSMTYAWRITQGSATFVGPTNAAQATLRAGNIKEAVKVELLVTDEAGAASLPATATLAVDNTAPVAVAGGQSFTAGGTAQLDGSGSYDQESPASALSYTWTCSDPGVVFTVSNRVAMPNVQVPAQPGLTITCSLVVSDGLTTSAPATVTRDILPTDATAIFVDAAASCPCDGTKAKPFTTINAATAASDVLSVPKPVFVASGTYSAAITTSRVSLIGGCDHTTWVCQGTTGPTTIQAAAADAAALAVSGFASTPARIRGFEIRASSGSSVAGTSSMGIACQGCVATFEDLDVTADGNAANITTTIAISIASTGGPVRVARTTAIAGRARDNFAIWITNSSNVTVTESTLSTLTQPRPTASNSPTTNTTVYVNGAGTNVRIERNQIEVNGDGTISACQDVRIDNNPSTTLAGNFIWMRAACSGLEFCCGGDAVATSAIVLGISTPATIINNTILGNDAAYAANKGNTAIVGFVGCNAGGNLITNNIIDDFALGMEASNACTHRYRNNAFNHCANLAHNSAFGMTSNPADFDNGVAIAGAVAGGGGNLAVDCQLANRTTGDWHLAAGSPCIDTGITDSAAPTWDLDDPPTPRPAGSTIDRGADEVSP